jgi:hypothetical protein
MPLPETLGSEQQSLRAQAREFAGDVLARVRGETDPLQTPVERYRATRPFYRQMVESGFLMRVVGVDSYGHHLPLAGLVQDVLAYPLFSGGNIGFRRRRLQVLLADPDYDPWCTMACP